MAETRDGEMTKSITSIKYGGTNFLNFLFPVPNKSHRDLRSLIIGLHHHWHLYNGTAPILLRYRLR